MTKRRLQTALVGKLRVAVPCSTDPQSVSAARDAIAALPGKLPEGSTMEFIGEPQFGKVPVAAMPTVVTTQTGNATGVTEITTTDGVITEVKIVAHGDPYTSEPAGLQPTGARTQVVSELPESLRRVPRHG